MSNSGLYPQNFQLILSAILFAVLIAFYATQANMALSQARQHVKDGDGKVYRATLLDVIAHDNNWVRDLWTFFVLTMVFPVSLNTMGNVHGLTESDSDSIGLWSAMFYHGCVAVVVVTITLEFSYVYNLRESAQPWIRVLLVAIALDIGMLLVLFLVVEHPNAWPALLSGAIVQADESPVEIALAGPDIFTSTAMVLAAVFALLSSATILVFSRAAGAVADGNVDLAAIEQHVTSQQEVGPKSRPVADHQETDDGKPAE